MQREYIKYTGIARPRREDFANFTSYYYRGEHLDDPLKKFLDAKIAEFALRVPEGFYNPVNNEGFKFKTQPALRCFKGKNQCLPRDVMDHDCQMQLQILLYDFETAEKKRVTGVSITVKEIRVISDRA